MANKALARVKIDQLFEDAAWSRSRDSGNPKLVGRGGSARALDSATTMIEAMAAVRAAEVFGGESEPGGPSIGT